MKIPKFQMRASASSRIMGVRGLGKTGETYLKDWMKGQLYKRHVEIKSKYLEKGNIMEDDSLDEVAKHMGIALLVKNEKHFETEFLRGTPDAIVGDCIIDVKNSWSWETFPLIEAEIPNDAYYWQLQSYMALTGKSISRLVYTLLDTPMHLIEREARFYCSNNGYQEDDYLGILDKFVKKMTYSDVPDKLKYKSFDLDRDDEAIDRLIERVKECQVYVKAMMKTLKL